MGKIGLLLCCPLFWGHPSSVLEDSEERTLVGEARLKAYGRHLPGGVRAQQLLSVLQAVVVDESVEGAALGVDAGGDRIAVDVDSLCHIGEPQGHELHA